MESQNSPYDFNEQQYGISPEVNLSAYMTRVFGWMGLALTITAVTSMLVVSNNALAGAILNSPLLWVLLIGELLLVGVLVGAIHRMSSVTATAVFIGYAILNGLTLSMLYYRYTFGSIALCFFISAGVFAFMAVYGYFTKNDLTSVGNLMFMGLIGIIIASIANLFAHSDTLYWIISYAGVFIFIGLTAYDAQKIKQQAMVIGNDSETVQKSAI